MTKQERDDIVLRAWQERMRERDGIPAKLADTYTAWMRRIMQQASGVLAAEQAPQQEGGAGGGGEQQKAG